MPTCPEGHDTPSTDFCDVCGIRVGAPMPAPPPSATGAAPASGRRCPGCGADGSGQFCETCGYSFAAGRAAAERGRVRTAPGYAVTPPGQPAAPAPGIVAGNGSTAAWTAVVTADRAYFDRVVAARGPDAGRLQFPDDYPERRFRLSGPEMRIGRRSASRGLEPEIDLTGPPLDPGISHLHAVLAADPDGGWTVYDPGSANGTQVNGREVPAGARVRLGDGDRVCLGAWTVLTIQAA
jgi:FHA domain